MLESKRQHGGGMDKAFTKGERVTLIQSWDNKGTAAYRHAVVYSCGKARMVLTSEATGEEIGRNFTPARGNMESVAAFNWYGVFTRMTDEDAAALCLDVGARVVEAARAQYRACVARNNSPEYRAAMDKNEAELHEPRVLRHPER